MTKQLSPLRSIRVFCRICNGENPTGGHYYDCLDHNCILYPFKKGKGNYEADAENHVTEEHKSWLKDNGSIAKSSRVVSEEQKQKFKERARKMWETRKAKQQIKEE